jgi:hypothetical protein
VNGKSVVTSHEQSVVLFCVNGPSRVRDKSIVLQKFGEKFIVGKAFVTRRKSRVYLLSPPSSCKHVDLALARMFQEIFGGLDFDAIDQILRA